jgi:alpha-methylacyl-CoA racemase
MSRSLGTPITLDGKAEAAMAPAPQVGEHSRAVLRELGYSEAEIDALIEAKAVQQV